MTGGTFSHDTIGINIVSELRSWLRDKPRQPHGKDLKLLIGNKVRYPDAHVSCGQYQNADKHGRDPVVIFDVLNDSIERTDLVEKNEEHVSLPSVAISSCSRTGSAA